MWLVVVRELRERGRSTAYLLSSGFTLLLLVGLIVVPQLFDGGPVTYRVGVVGNDGGLIGAARAIAAAEDPEQRTVFEVTAYPAAAAAEDQLSAGELEAVLVDGHELVLPGAGGFFGSELAGRLQTAAATVRVQELVSEQGEAAAEVIDALTSHPLEVRTLSGISDPESDIRAVIAYAGLVLMYIAILSYGVWTLTGVTEEKGSRVIEVLLATLKPWQLFAGKIAGIGVLGLIQLLITIAAGLVAVSLTEAIEIPAIPVESMVVLVVWFILGYSLYAASFAAAGSLVSRPEDAQNASFPLSLVAVVGFIVSFQVLDDPSSLLATIAALIPFIAPYVVPIRMALDSIAWWEVLAAGLVMVATIVVLVRVSARIYAGALLQFGGRVRLRAAWRAAAE
jgi:ABC-2 type transport system permease protein